MITQSKQRKYPYSESRKKNYLQERALAGMAEVTGGKWAIGMTKATKERHKKKSTFFRKKS